MMKKIFGILGLALCLMLGSLVGLRLRGRQSLAQAQARGAGVELTVYNQNFALVKDKRSLTLEKGTNTISFTDVAAQIDPTSVLFHSLTDPEGTRVLEQDYEYDIASSAKLLGKYIDQKVSLVTEDGTKYEGTLLSGAGDIIIQDEAGAVTLVKLASVKEFNFPELPTGLITKPTLLWLLESAEGGQQDAEVTYLTNGLNWHAEYVASLAPDNESMDFKAWVTLDNRSGATYEEAKLKLMAGDVRRVQRAEVIFDKRMVAEAEAAPAPAPQFAEEAVFEYHRYTLERPATIKDNQSKQIELVSAAEVPVEKFFVYDGAQMRGIYYGAGPMTQQGYGVTGNQKVFIMLEFENGEEQNLGIPLPQGTVRVYQSDPQGGADFVGEDTIDHTAKDESVRLYIGNAFDLVGERKQTHFRKIGQRALEETFEITLRNHKEEEVEIRVVEHLFRWSNWEILEASHDYEKLDASTIEFRVEVPADGEAEVTYTVRYEW